MTTPDTIASYWVPIDPDHLTRISELLREADVFTPSFVAPEEDRYNAAVYRHQATRFATSTRILADRNLVSRWVAVVRGVSPDPAHRLAAGVMAFAQCAEIDIEPNMAFYEVAQRHGNEAAHEELVAFRFADHTHPGYWADLALGADDEVLPPPVAPGGTADQLVDFEMKLRRWKRHYVLILKLAELELTSGSAVERLETLLDWMDKEFLLSGPAIALAAIYLAPNARRRGLLKNLRAANRERALDGIRNAAWDLSLISEWLTAVERQYAESRLTLLASLDRSMHLIARAVSDISDATDSSTDRFAQVLGQLWGERDGTRLALKVNALYSTRKDESRQINLSAPTDYVSECIARGEAAIRSWRSRT